MSALPHIIDELTAALSYQGTSNPPIHENIWRMFLRDESSLAYDDQVRLANKRFEVARKLYQGIAFNVNTPAIFYRLEDKMSIVNLYEKSGTLLRDKFKNYINENKKASSKENLNSFLSMLCKNLGEKIQKSLEEESELKIANYIIDLLKNNEPQIVAMGEINKWFYNLRDSIQNLASKAFYGVSDILEAFRIGRIYNPEEMHNWGVNAAWALGVASQKLPINIQGELNMRNGERTKSDKKGNPSAFALEIAIAVKMGYGLHITNQAVKLNPPEVLNVPRTNGIPGDGILPTKEEQLKIYHQCVLAQNLHTKLLMEANKAAALKNSQISFAASASAVSASAVSNRTDSKEREEKITSDNVNILMQNKGLFDFVYDSCINSNESVTLELIGALELLRRGNSLEPILNALQSREHKALWSVLGSNSFESTAYDNLKKIVSSHLPENQKLPFLGVSASASSASAASAATASNHFVQHQESVAFPSSSDNPSSQAGAQIPAKSFLPSYMQSTKSSRMRVAERKRQQEEAARAKATEAKKDT